LRRARSPRSSSRIHARALAWTVAHRDLFAAPLGPRESRPLKRVKRLSELAMASRVIGRANAGPDVLRLARGLAAFGWHALAEGDELAAAIAGDPGYPEMAAAYLQFHAAGHRSPSVERALVRACERCRTGDPTLALLVAVSMRRLSLRCPLPLPDLLTRCLRFFRVEVWPGRRRVYAFTHVVFFLTDLGAAPRALPAAWRDRAAAVAPIWLERAITDRNTDLIGEILMAARCARVPCPGDDDAWRILARAQRPSGWLPPRFDDRDPPSFSRVYHPTIVALMAAGLE
jgi:hypothetical protein